MDLGRNKIDTDLLALINNDIFIKGTRNLEKGSIDQTISYFHHFMSHPKNKFSIEDIFQSKTDKDNLDAFMNRMHSLSQANDEMNKIIFLLSQISKSNTSDRGTYYKDEKTIESAINLGVKDFVSRLMALNKSTASSPGSVLMAGGWLNSGSQAGHFLAYEFKKDKNGDYIFLVYNSGAGLEFHENVTSATKDKYKTVKAYKIPGIVTEAELNYFASELMKPNVLPITADRDPTKNITYNSKVLYEEVFRKVSYLKGEEIPLQEAELTKEVQELASLRQRAGTCAEELLHELMNLNIKEKKKAKSLLFFLKLFSIEEFVEQHQNSMDNKKVSQLKWASQNLSKSLLHRKDILPPHMQERATKALEQAQNLLEKSKQELAQSQSLDPIKNLSKEQVVPQSIGVIKDPTVDLQFSNKTISEKPYNLETVKHLSELLIPIEGKTLTLNLKNLESFKLEIERLISRGLHKDAEQALFDYFTQAPLNKSYFSLIKTPEDAIKYVELSNVLMAKYMKTSAANQNARTNPKKAAVILNLAESFNLLYQNSNLTIAKPDSGINALYDQTINFNTFKESQRHNVYLSTEIPTVDKRTKEILERTDGQSSLDLNDYVNYLNKSENQNFKKYLIQLFDKRRSPDEEKIKSYITSSGNYTSSSNIRDINDRKAFVAYFRYFELESGQYKNELDKLNLLKKMKVCCSRTFCKNFSSEYNSYFDEGIHIAGERFFEPNVVLPRNPNDSEWYYDMFSPRISSGSDKFSLGDGLNKFFNKINDQHNLNPLQIDENISKQMHDQTYSDNEIFFNPEGVKVEGDQVEQSVHGRLHQELMHLRTSPDLQILTTVDYFKERLHLFANKTADEDKDNVLKNDMQQYLRRNLFQPGLLLKQFERDPESYDVIQDSFLEKGILLFTKNNKVSDETLYFYDLQQDINQYALKSPNISDRRKSQIYTDMAITYKTLNEINKSELNQIERYELSKTKLKIQLILLDYINNSENVKMIPSQKEEHYKNLFHAYMDFSENSREIVSSSNTAENTAQLKQLKHLSFEMLKKDLYKDKIFDWALEYIKNNNLARDADTWEEISQHAQHKIGQFPYYYIRNSFEELAAMDLLEGQVIIKGSYDCYPPDALVNSPIYQSVCGTECPRMSVYNMQRTDMGRNTDVKVYRLPDSSNQTKAQFVETKSHHMTPFVYQQYLEFRKEKNYYEKRTLSDNGISEKQNSLSLRDSHNTDFSFDVAFNLPESFYSSETECWVACAAHQQRGAMYIEKKNGKYAVDMMPDGKTGIVKELDNSKNETGYILSLNYQDPKVESVLKVFKGFDSPQFTEILFKPSNDSSSTVEELKIKFPRYNLELEGKFDVKQQKWEIYQTSNPDLVLVHDQNIQIKPNIDISNSLIFEYKDKDKDKDKKNKQRFLYTPVQDYYIDPSEKHDERLSETVYYKPKLDNINVSKRLLQGKIKDPGNIKESFSATLARLTRFKKTGIPKGATTYSGAEEFRIFPIDNNTHELKTATSEDKLHLAYLDLVNLQPEEALGSIRSIIKTGGLKGTLKELELIEKIFNRTPLDSSQGVNKDLRIDSPEFVAVRTHILYLISDLYAKKNTFSIPDETKIKVETPDDFIKKEQLKTLKSFESAIPGLMHDHLHKSLNIYSATPKEMRLPKELEYKMIPRLENGYHLGLWDAGKMSKGSIQELTQYITNPPVLIRAEPSSRTNKKYEYYLIGKDYLGKNQITPIKHMELMNAFQFSRDIDNLNSEYVSDEKNRDLFLEIANKPAHVYDSKTVPIQARYQHLKNWYRTRELGKIVNKKPEPDDREKQLEKKLAKEKHTKTYEKKVETKNIQAPLIYVSTPMVTKRQHDYDVNTIIETVNFNTEGNLYANCYNPANIIAKGDPKTGNRQPFKVQDLHPNMTDEQFLERIIPILELAKSTGSDRKEARDILKSFLENTLKANCKILQEKQNSLIRNWAPSILTAIHNPNSFRDILLKDEQKKPVSYDRKNYWSGQYERINEVVDIYPNRHEAFVKSFLAKAYDISGDKKYTIQIKDYNYYLIDKFDISSKKFKKEKYIPAHMEVKPSTVYQNLTYEDFVRDAELQLFCNSMQGIKDNTEQEVNKLKILLNLEIRDSLLKQKVELIEAQINAKSKTTDSTDTELSILQDELKVAVEQYDADRAIIDKLVEDLKANLKIPSSEAVLLEREELHKKFIALTKEGRYEDTAKIKKEYDERIGALRNEEGERVYETTCNLLEKFDVRDKVSKTCEKFILEIDPKIEKLEKILLVLANRGPKDLEAQQKYQRELQARKRNPITMCDLNRLFVISDKKEYKKITGLDDDDIDILHQTMADNVNWSLLKQQYVRTKSELEKNSKLKFSDKININAITQLGRVIATNNMIPMTGYADIQFFQKEEDILITPLQKFYLDILLNKDVITDEYRSEVIQLIMGGGKSKVLGPLAMLKKADGINLPMFQVKSSLKRINFADMSATSNRLFNQEAVLFHFDRNTPCSSKDLKEIFNLFHKTAINKGYVVTSGDDLKSFELKYFETIREKPNNTNPNSSEYIEWNKRIKWFEKTLDFMEFKVDRVIDEVHDELDSNKELNYTIGDAVPPSKEDIKLTIDTIYFLREVSLSKAELGIEKEIKAIDLIYNNKFITDPKTQMPKVMAQLAHNLVNNLNTTNINPIAKIVAKLDLKHESEKQALIAYLLNQSPEFLPVLKSKLNEKELKELAFVKSQVSKFLPVTLLKNYNENYGPSRKEGLTQIQRKLAIPYTELNTPNEKSRFGEFTESMDYTVFMNIIEPISTELVQELIKEYIEKAQTEQVDSLNAKFETTSASIEYNVKFGKVTRPTLEQIKNYLYDDKETLVGSYDVISDLFFDGKPNAKELERIISEAKNEQLSILTNEKKSIKISETEVSQQFDATYRLNKEPKVIELKQISNLNKAYSDCLVNIFKESEDFKKVVLSDYVLRQVESNPLVLTNNSQDSGGMTKTTQAMSGTPHNFKTYHTKISFNEAQGLGTDGETVSLLKNKKTPVVDSSAYESVSGLLEEFFDLNNHAVDEETKRNTRAIIDAGALFKKEKSNFSIAQQIGQFCTKNPNKFSSDIKYVLYTENQGDVLHAWDIKNQKKIKLGSSDEKEISKILNCVPEERFTLYDQARITGTDIVQAKGLNSVIDPMTGKETTFSANAILTFSEKTSKSAFLQAAKRMRDLHNKQTISVIKADYLQKRLPSDNDINEVLSFVNQVQVDKALQLHFKSTGHKFKHALRSNFKDKIRHLTQDPMEKNRLLEAFNPIFYKNFQPNHFLNHGAVETEQDAMLYFPVMAEKYYDQWEKLLEDAEIIVSDQEKETMKKTLDALASDAIDICEKTFKSKPIERISAEMAQDDNLGNEVENELQNELEIQMQQELELEKELITYDKTKQKHAGSHFELPLDSIVLADNPQKHLFSVSKKVITDIPFDENIFMTSCQRQTIAGHFSNYYEQHVKPFHVVMMVAQKNQPKTLQCVILTKEEAQAHINRERPPTNHNYNAHRDVWFVSCHDTVLYGKKPTWLQSEDSEPKPEDLLTYNRALEQVRYINGELNTISKQKNGLTWLSENSKEKLDFISNTIVKRFPESNKYYGNLKSRLDVNAKILNYMQTHPFENYLDENYNWDDISKGSLEKKADESFNEIIKFAQALNDINTIHATNHKDSRLSRNELEKNYEPQIAYRLNQHKESFLDKRTRIIESLSKNQSLDFVLSDQYKDIDLNFLVNQKTLFEIILNNKLDNTSISNVEILFSHFKKTTKNMTKDKDAVWTQKNGDLEPKSNAELLVLHAIEKNTKERKNINDTLLEMVGGKNKDSEKVSKLITAKNPDVNLLILAVKHNNLPLLKCIEDEYLSSFQEKDLKDILQVAQKYLTTGSSPEIRKLIQIHGKDGDLIEKHKRLRTIVFDKIEKWIDSDYSSQATLDFSKRPFSTSKLDFDGFTDEDKIFIKTVIDKLIEKPNKSICEYFNKKDVLKQPNMLDKKTVLTDVMTHSENVLDKDLNAIITILISNQADVKSAFALALESLKSMTVLKHLKSQNGVDIYFNPDKADNEQFLLLRNYKKDSTEELVRKISVCHDLNADLSGVLDNKGNTIIHNLCTLEKDPSKLDEIVLALSGAVTFDINCKNSVGSTALHMAISSGNVAMVKGLLAQKDDEKQDKIDIDIKDGNDKTAMDLVTEALQKDEKFNPEIVTLVSEAYKRKHKEDYLADIPVEKMLAEEIWVYINDVLPTKVDAFNDKTLVNRMIHAHSRNETEFNIHKSEFYQYLKNNKLEHKILGKQLNFIELYDNIQFDKSLIGVEQKIEDFDAPKLAEIKKEKLEKYSDKWPRDDAIAIQTIQEYDKSVFEENEQTVSSDIQKIALFIRNSLDKQAKTTEEFYDAKKTFISYIKTLAELPAEDAIFDKQKLNEVLESLKHNPHKFFPSYKASEQIKTTEVKSQEYTGGSTEPEKDWSKIAHGYLADVITSGQYLNNYQNIPFNDFISGNTSSQEEFNKLKDETKKYLNLVFQDTIQEKKFVIGALNKVSFKSKIEEKVNSGLSNVEQSSSISPEIIASDLFEKISSIPKGFEKSNDTIINEMLHEVSSNERTFNTVKEILRSNIAEKRLSNAGAARMMLFKMKWDSALPEKILAKRAAENLEKENETKKLEEASKNPKTENTGPVLSGQPQIIEKSVTAQNKNIKSTKFYDKNYSIIAKEIFNYALPFTNNYKKSFSEAYKIKLKEHAKTTEDFDEINSELKVLFKKQLPPEQTKIATAMLSSVKATDLGFKPSVPKVEPKKVEPKVGVQTEPKASVTTPQKTTQQPKPSVVVAQVTTPPVQPSSIQPVEQPKPPVSKKETDVTQSSQPQGVVTNPVTPPIVIPQPLSIAAKLIAELENYLPDKFKEMQQLDKAIQAELQRLASLKVASPAEVKDLNNASQIIKSFINFKALIDKENELKQMSQIPLDIIKDLFSKAEKALQQSDKDDFGFAYDYLNRARNILTTKIDPSLFKLNNLLNSNISVKDEDIKLYSLYLNDLEILSSGYEQLENIESKHKLFEKTKVTYHEQNKKNTVGLLNLIHRHHTRVTEIEKLTAETYNLMAGISKTDRAKLFPNKINTLNHFEGLMTLLKDKSAIAATQARNKQEAYTQSSKQPQVVVQPASPIIPPTQQEINKATQEKALELLKDLEPLTQEMNVFQGKFERAQNVHDFTVYFGEKYQHLLSPLDKKYHVSSTIGVTLENVCEEILKMPLANTSANQNDIKKVISDIKSNGDKNVPEINLNLSELLIKSWNLAKQLPAIRNEKETVLLLLQDNKLADGGCLPGIGARLISGYSTCVREILDTELYNALRAIDFNDIDTDQKSRLLTDSALGYIGKKTNNFKATPSKGTGKNPDFKVDVDFMNTLLHAHSTTEDEFYKNKLVLLKTIYQQMSPTNRQKRHEFDTAKMMFDLINMNKAQLGKGSVPSDFVLIKMPDKPASISTGGIVTPQVSLAQIKSVQLINEYNTHVIAIQEILNDNSILQYLEKIEFYKEFKKVFTSAKEFYDNNKANQFFADNEKINLEQKIASMSLARTNFLISLKTDIEDKLAAKPQADLQVEKKQFEQILADLNNAELIHSAFEQKDKDELMTKIKDKIQDIDKLINPVIPPTPPKQPDQVATTSPMLLNFDLALHCKASAWHNNCALNCLTHYLYSKLESNGVQEHFNNDPAYNLLRESFKDYYNLKFVPTWDQIKSILDDYPVAHDREAVMAPVFRKYLSKIMVKEKDAIWNTEAVAAISDYLVTGDVADVAETIFKVNKTRLIELKKQFDAENSAINPNSFTQQEKETAKEKIEQWNKHPDITTGHRKKKDPNNISIINDQVFIQRRISIENKYADLAYKEWMRNDGFCEKYAKHMENLSNAELVSVNQLGLITKELGIGLEVFTTTHKYNLGADVRPQASETWVLKAYNPTENHWEYEEPTKNEAKTIQHNKDYINRESGVFRTLSDSNPMSDDNIKKAVVQKWNQKGFSMPSVSAQNAGGVTTIPPTMPNVDTKPQQPVQVQSTLSTSSPFDANVIADEIYQEAKVQTKDFTVAHLKMFSEKINNKVNNKTDFNAVVKALKEDVLNIYLDQEPTKLNLAIKMLGKPKYVPKVSLQSTQPSVSTNVAEQAPRWSASLKANEILLQVMAETDNFKNQDASKTDKLEETFAERLNLHANNQDEFNRIVTSLGVETKSNDFEKGRIYYYLHYKQGLDDSIIRKVKRAADVNYKPFKGTEQERKQAIERSRQKYQSNPLAKTLSDSREMANDILLIAMNETDNFKKTASQNIQDTLSAYLSEYTYTQEEFDAVIEELLASSSNTKGLINNQFNLNKKENTDPNHKAKELFKQIFSRKIAKRIYDKIILVSGSLEDASNTYIVGRLHEYAKSEQQFNDIKQEFSKLVTDPSRKKVILTIPFDPTTIGIKALQSANLSTSSGLSPTQPNIPVTTPNIPIQTQPQPIVTQPVVVVSQQSSGIPPTQSVPVSNPVPVQQPSPTGVPQASVPQQVVTGENQATPSTPPVIAQPQQSGGVTPTQSVPVTNPMKVQQPSPVVVAQPPVITSPQGAIGVTQATPNDASVAPIQSQQSVLLFSSSEPKTTEKIVEDLYAEIMKLPNNFNNLNNSTISNWMNQVCSSESEFNEIKEKLRGYIASKKISNAGAARMLIFKIKYNPSILTAPQQGINIPSVQTTLSPVVYPPQPVMISTPIPVAVQSPQQQSVVTTKPVTVSPPIPQQSTNANQVSQGTSPSQTSTQSVVVPTQPSLPPTQPVPVINPNPAQIQQPSVVTKQGVTSTTPQQSVITNQASQGGMPLQPAVTAQPTINQNSGPIAQPHQPAKSTQAFLPGFSGQASAQQSSVSIPSSSEPRTTEKIAEDLYIEIMKLPNNFNNLNNTVIANLMHQTCSSESEFNNIKEKLRGYIATMQPPNAGAARMLIFKIKCNPSLLNASAKVRMPGSGL